MSGEVKKAVTRIAEAVAAMSGSFSPYVIFSDWVKMYAISISNMLELHKNEVWKKRERAYLDIVCWLIITVQVVKGNENDV